MPPPLRALPDIVSFPSQVNVTFAPFITQVPVQVKLPCISTLPVIVPEKLPTKLPATLPFSSMVVVSVPRTNKPDASPSQLPSNVPWKGFCAGVVGGGGVVVCVVVGGGVVVVGEGVVVGGGVVVGIIVVGWVVGGGVVLSDDEQDASKRANTVKHVKTKAIKLCFIAVTPLSFKISKIVYKLYYLPVFM